jgi:aminoglycoside phosphotransferase family enzyme
VVDEANGAVVDWAVHMRRLSDEARAEHLLVLARGALDANALRAVAERIAEFHALSPADAHTAKYGALEVIARNQRG